MVRRSDNTARKTVRSDDEHSGGVARKVARNRSGAVARKTVRHDDDSEESGGVPRGDASTTRKTAREQKDEGRRKKSKPVKNNKAEQERLAIQRIRLRRRNDYLIPRAPFFNLVKEIMCKFYCTGGAAGDRYRIQRAALDALQLSSETYLVHLFEDMNILTEHAKRKTLMYQDFQTLCRLRINSGDTVMFDYKKTK